MTQLLYCVFRSDADAAPGLEELRLRGVDEAPVAALAAGAVTAAISSVSSAELAPTLERLRAYDAVIETLFRDRTVVPMRYGGTFADAAAVASGLAREAPRFERLLGRLEGRVEMGVRWLSGTAVEERRETGWARAATPSPSSSSSPRADSPVFESAPVGAGQAYLRARRDELRERAPTGEQHAVVEHLASALAGRFAEVKVEEPGSTPSAGAALAGLRLSLYFLVPRDEVTPFREALARASSSIPGRLVVSGPWPAYNFVIE